MEPFLYAKLKLAGLGLTGALLAVLVGTNRSFAHAFISVACGIFLAVIGTDPLADALNLSDKYVHFLAAVIGISGRNLVSFIVDTGRDPIGLLLRLRENSSRKPD